MDLGGLRDRVLEVNLSTNGVPVTITRPFDPPLTSSGIWRPSDDEDLPEGKDFNRRSPRRRMALPRADVGTIPIGSLMSAPEKPGGTARDWKVDGYDNLEDNHLTVVLVPVAL